jgi:Rieske 2Fe-2S family protein
MGRAAAQEIIESGGDLALIDQARLRDGAETLSMDGKIHGAVFHQLSEEERMMGYRYLVSLPNMFMAAHPDYVRLVSMFPLGPERMMLRAEWLFPDETLTHPEFDLDNVVQFGKLVMEQDGAISEVNHAGLRTGRLDKGTLLPQEAYVHLFLQWVRGEMGELEG